MKKVTISKKELMEIEFTKQSLFKRLRGEGFDMSRPIQEERDFYQDKVTFSQEDEWPSTTS